MAYSKHRWNHQLLNHTGVLRDMEGLMELGTAVAAAAAAAVLDSYHLHLGAFPTVQVSPVVTSRTGIVALVVQYRATISH